MRGIQHHDIHLRLHKGLHALQHIGRNADGRAAQKPSLFVLGGQRVLNLLLNILDGDETLQIEILVHNRKLLHTGLGQNRLGLLERNALPGCHQVLCGHAFLDRTVEIFLKFQIPVCDDAHQLLSLGNGNAGNAELCHKVIGIPQGVLRREKERIRNNAVFRTFYPVNLLSLLLNRHILMDYADAALPRHSNRHAVLRHRIHTRTHQRDIQLNLFGQICGQIHLIGDHFRVGRHQKHVIKRNAFTDNFSHKLSSLSLCMTFFPFAY